jgi:hypothetical protein
LLLVVVEVVRFTEAVEVRAAFKRRQSSSPLMCLLLFRLVLAVQRQPGLTLVLRLGRQAHLEA